MLTRIESEALVNVGAQIGAATLLPLADALRELERIDTDVLWPAMCDMAARLASAV